MYEDITQAVFEAGGIRFESRHALEIVAQSLRERCQVMMPEKRDSLAVAPNGSKTAALAFDKVYKFPVVEGEPPPEIGFFCGTKSEVVVAAALLLSIGVKQGIVKGVSFEPPDSAEQLATIERNIYRHMCRDIRRDLGLEPTICYADQASCDADFQPGPQELLASSLAGIQVVDEAQIEWEQVLEFRRDSNARMKYRRLIRWLDAELRAAEPEAVEDLIVKRLEDYEWSLRKHGLRASLGTVSALIDPRFLASTSAAVAGASVAGGEFWAWLAGAGLTIGKAVVSFGNAAIDGEDHRRNHNFEVAYVSELKKYLQ